MELINPKNQEAIEEQAEIRGIIDSIRPQIEDALTEGLGFEIRTEDERIELSATENGLKKLESIIKIVETHINRLLKGEDKKITQTRHHISIEKKEKPEEENNEFHIETDKAVDNKNRISIPADVLRILEERGEDLYEIYTFREEPYTVGVISIGNAKINKRIGGAKKITPKEGESRLLISDFINKARNNSKKVEFILSGDYIIIIDANPLEEKIEEKEQKIKEAEKKNNDPFLVEKLKEELNALHDENENIKEGLRNKAFDMIENLVTRG